MNAMMKAILIGSVAVLAAPQASDAFSPGALPGVDDGARASGGQPVLMAQAADQTVELQQLQEAVRKLTGRVEDLNYQLLQTQEQMRQMQKDNEFRFQRLEGNSSGGAAAPTSDDRSQATPPPGQSDRASRTLPGVEPGITASTAASTNRGAPPKPLGTVTFDANGNIVSDTMAPPGDNASGNEMASLPPSASPKDIYRNAYDQLLNGDFKAAESGFRDYIDIFPDGPKAADATYWLGESEFSQGKFNAAAKTFLDAHKKYPDAKKAPETLLKLGMALAALNNQDTACATYREVLKRYPDASPDVRKKVAGETKRAGC